MIKRSLAKFSTASIFLLTIFSQITAEPYPIGFSIPESKIVKEIPEKDRDFAFIIPGNLSTYIYTEEADYYKDYQRSYFAITFRKGGADCLRHYEILANGCIPYFTDLDLCHEKTMHLLPRELIKEAMNLEGVSYDHIDHSKFDREKYYEILEKLLEHTRKFLSTKQMANYILETLSYSGRGKVLYLSQDPGPDYLRCLTLIGLKQALGDKVVDIPKVDHIYESYPGNIKQLYGRGMSYTKIIEDIPVDRNSIEERIKNKEFELIIYGSVHRGLPYHDLVLQTYESEKIAYLCGDDFHSCGYSHFPNLFLREYDSHR